MTNVQIEEISETKKKIIFEIPEDRVREVVDEQYRDLKKTAQIKGFRKGKVPLEILRSYFKTQVEADVSRKIIEDTFQPTLDEKKIDLVHVIKIDPETIEVGRPFKYTAEIEVPPAIEAKDYRGIKLTKRVTTVTDEQVEERIQRLRERHARLSPLPEGRGVGEGDHLVVDVEAQVEGETVKALSVEDYHMELGRNFYLPDFDEMLYGMKVDESKQISKELPEDFPRKELAGKTATFDVTIKDAKERILPELDDDFAKDLGEFQTLADLRENVAIEIRGLYEETTGNELRLQIVEGVIESNPFEVPDSMVEREIDRELRRSLENLIMQGIDPKRIPQPTQAQRDRFRPSATRAVKAFLILAAVGKQEGIEVSEEELGAEIQKRAEMMGVSEDHLKDQLSGSNMYEDFREALAHEKAYKLIIDHAEITEEEAASAGEASETETEKE